MNKVCTKCHVEKPLSEFYTKTDSPDGYRSICKSCIKLSNNKYYITNTEQVKRKTKLYYSDNKEQANLVKSKWYSKNRTAIRLLAREYHKAHKEQIQNRVNEWIKQNPERNRQLKLKALRKRRALKLNIKESYTTLDEQYTRTLFNNACANCGATENLTIDHHYPLSKGNALTRDNAVVLCRYCNSAKHNTMPEDFYSPETLAIITEKLKPLPS